MSASAVHRVEGVHSAAAKVAIVHVCTATACCAAAHCALSSASTECAIIRSLQRFLQSVTYVTQDAACCVRDTSCSGLSYTYLQECSQEGTFQNGLSVSLHAATEACAGHMYMSTKFLARQLHICLRPHMLSRRYSALLEAMLGTRTWKNSSVFSLMPYHCRVSWH